MTREEQWAKRKEYNNSLKGLRKRREHTASRIGDITRRLRDGDNRCRDQRPMLRERLLDLDATILSKVSMPTHTQIRIEIDSIVEGNCCCEMHHRESLDDIIKDLLTYQEKIATKDEYQRANKL